MKHCNKPGYPGKDAMRENAERLVGKDAFKKIETNPSNSAVQFLKARPYKKGGAVKATKSKTELHIPGQMKMKKSGNVPMTATQSGNLQAKADKLKSGGKVKMKHPKPIVAGKHAMNGMKAKSPKFANAEKFIPNTKRKAKDTNSLDASHGEYLKRGGKVKQGR